MIISCVDTSDWPGEIASWAMNNPISIAGKDTAAMVALVLQRAGEIKISRLNIMDHGTEKTIQIGTDRISSGAFSAAHPALKSKYHKELEKLQGHFTQDGSVFLMQCNSGACIPLIRGFARAVDVPVYATPYKYQGLLHTTSRTFLTPLVRDKNEATDAWTSAPPYVRVTPAGAVTTLFTAP
jgi:hypothetical protein